jgi:hypothetical protein
MAVRNPTRDDDEFLNKARERFTAAKDYWDKIYIPAKDALEFYGGEQWPLNIRNQRESDVTNPRPVLTINRLPQFHNQIVNAYRQATLSMNASPQEQEDVQVALTYEGLFRQIEKQSHAQTAYIKALSDGTIHSVGYIRAVAEYANDDSFDQDLFIKREVNPFRHYPDPKAVEFFLEDSKYWFVIDKVSETEYEDGGEYEDFDPADFTGEESDRANWRGDREVTVAEYFYFDNEHKELHLMEDGSTVWEDDLKELAGDEQDKVRKAIKKSRKVEKKVLKWCKIDGYNVLEKAREMPTPRIPIVPVWGNELWIGEERKLTGITQGAKDSQRMYNYWQSAKTEMIALAPKAPYIAAEGQLEGEREAEWRDAAHTAKSVLYYKPVSVDGHLVGAPQRQVYEAPVQGIIQASLQSSDDMKATIGIYDSSLGQQGNEVSGKAILARKTQGATATFNFVDNLGFAIGYLGTIIGEYIPVIYDTKRILKIVGKDGKTSSVTVNGGEGTPDLVNIKYDLVLDSGPSYATQREETASVLTELARQWPKLWDVAGDIAIRNMNIGAANEIADRLKRTLPPEVVGDDADPVTKLAAASNTIKQMQAALSAATDKINALEQSEQLNEAKLADKSGELKIRQQELRIKEKEVEAKLITAGAAAASSKENASAGPLVAEAMDAIKELGGQFTGVMDMIEALAGSNAPATGAGGSPASGAEGQEPAPDAENASDDAAEQ